MSREMNRSRKTAIIDSFHVYGTSHKCAPIDVREQLAVSPDDLEQRLRQLTEEAGIQEAVILSTCSRSEFYVCGEARDLQPALDEFWKRTFRIETAHLQQHVYFKSGPEAIRHLFRVAHGLDSLIVGESQASQRLEDALAASHSSGACGAIIDTIFTAALQSAKRVEVQTRIGRGNLSLGHTVAQLLEKIFGSIAKGTVLIMGEGNPVEFAAKDLGRFSEEQIWISSPKEAKAKESAQKLRNVEEATAWCDVLEAISQADVVVSGSVSGRHILQRSDYEQIRPLRRRRALFLFDLNVPRGFDLALSSYGEVFLYNVDDIAALAAADHRRYDAEIQRSELLVQREVETFHQQLQNDSVSGTLLALKRQLEHIRQEQLAKNRSNLQNLTSEQQQHVDCLTSAITRKVFREVARELKQSAKKDGGKKLSKVVSLVFGLI